MKAAFKSVAILLLGANGALPQIGPASAGGRGPAFVSLAASQTSIRSQGGRNSCITFAAVAALEAAYKRAGYGDLDLSEEFLSNLGKTFWLHYPILSEPIPSGNDARETQVAAFGGGGGVGSLRYLAEFMRIPVESVMPYHNINYGPGDHPHLSHAWDDWAFWTQRRMDDVNLSPRFLPPAALIAPKYYSARGFHSIPATAEAIEQALSRQHEVVVDMNFSFRAVDGINYPASGNAPHAVLIVGYDRRDPRKPFFLVKNSWGDADYWKISYECVSAISGAGYIDGVNAPRTWPELQILGRWNLDYDGFRGTLDIYHLPGAGDPIIRQIEGGRFAAVRDQRLGTFYDESGKAFKVNGTIDEGGTLTFYLDLSTPYPRWDALRGRQFRYRPVNSERTLLAGSHRDADGSMWGGYAIKGDFLPRGVSLRGPATPASYLGNWTIEFNNRRGTLRLLRRDESVVSSTESATYYGLTGEFEIGGERHPATVLVSRISPNTIVIRSPGTLGAGPDGSALTGRLMSRDTGLVAGDTALPYRGLLLGFIMTRQ